MNHIKQKQRFKANILKRRLKTHKPNLTTKPSESEQDYQTANDYATGKVAEYGDGVKNKAIQSADFSITHGKTQLTRQIKSRQFAKTLATKNTLRPAAKATTKSIKTINNTARTTAKTVGTGSKFSVKSAQTAAKTAKFAARASARTVTLTVKSTAKFISIAARAVVAALKGLIAAIAAGGWIAVVVILVICLLALVISSGFGIFYANEPSDPNAVPITQAMNEVSFDFYAEIERLKEEHQPDRIEMVGDSINWPELLSIFSVKTSTENEPIAQMTPQNVGYLQNIFDDMVSLSYEVETVEIDPPPDESDEEINADDEEKPPTTETVLTITIEQKPYTDMMSEYGFNDDQTEQVELLLSEQFRDLWVELIGGFMQGTGQIIVSGANLIPTDRFSYPLPDTYRISSYFGWRSNPFTGEPEWHNAIDIAAPQGTPVLAAESGTVTIANSWSSTGYGYYVKLQHSDGYETLYAHCFAISVTAGQPVQKGEVIGYVGRAGNSTGNHLHFEVTKDGVDVDPLLYFRQV